MPDLPFTWEMHPTDNFQVAFNYSQSLKTELEVHLLTAPGPPLLLLPPNQVLATAVVPNHPFSSIQDAFWSLTGQLDSAMNCIEFI